MRACAAPRSSAAFVLVLGVLLSAALSAQAGPVRTIHLRIAGEEATLKTPPVSDGREIYLPLESLRLLGASYLLMQHDEAAFVTSRQGVHTEVVLARPGGVFMLPLSDLARALGITYTLTPDGCNIQRPGDPEWRRQPDPERGARRAQTTVVKPSEPAKTQPTSPPTKPSEPKGNAGARDNQPTQPAASPDGAPNSTAPSRSTLNGGARSVVPPGNGGARSVVSSGSPLPRVGEGPGVRADGGRLQRTDDPDGPQGKPAGDTPPTNPTGTSPAGGTGGQAVQPPTTTGPAGPMGAVPAPANKITDVRFEALDDRHARLHVVGIGKLAPRAILIDGGARLALEVPGCAFDLQQRDWPVQHPFVSAFHAVQAEGSTIARVVLDLERVIGWYTVPESGGFALNLALPRGAGRKMQGLIVVVDPGHGGPKSTGASAVVNGHTLYEKNLTLSMGKKLQEALADSGVNAILTRTRDEDVGLSARPAVAAHNNADLFVSIHVDDCPGSNTASGTTVYYHMSDPSSRALAHTIVEHISRVSGLPSRGARSDQTRFPATGMAVLRGSPVPAVLIEVGYINNARDRAKLTNGEFQQQVAEAIRDGIRAYVEGGLPADTLLASDSK